MGVAARFVKPPVLWEEPEGREQGEAGAGRVEWEPCRWQGRSQKQGMERVRMTLRKVMDVLGWEAQGQSISGKQVGHLIIEMCW